MVMPEEMKVIGGGAGGDDGDRWWCRRCKR